MKRRAGLGQTWVIQSQKRTLSFELNTLPLIAEYEKIALLKEMPLYASQISTQTKNLFQII